ncbi:hypothetical protein P9H28_21535 [Paenibacillus barengoltzii]|nr:hypothetical protein [Paenibacillus barengoltzii]MEC2346661.1 hypothetical protein [Paenibacillus barengoltzii]
MLKYRLGFEAIHRMHPLEKMIKVIFDHKAVTFYGNIMVEVISYRK